MLLRFGNEPTKIGHEFAKYSVTKMAEIENGVNKSSSFNLTFLRENQFQKDYICFWLEKLTSNFQNALFLSAYFQILVTVWKEIIISGWSVFKTAALVEWAILSPILPGL